MGNLGWSEIFFIVVFALIIFGPRRLPEIARTMGRYMAMLKRASAEFQQTWETELQKSEIAESLKKANTDLQETLEKASLSDGTQENPALAASVHNGAHDEEEDHSIGDHGHIDEGVASLVAAAEDHQIQIHAVAEAVAKTTKGRSNPVPDHVTENSSESDKQPVPIA